jgi:2-desacetyl-2-hydroxyethyl bacteriochlorophyllide A dehydrogenase
MATPESTVLIRTFNEEKHLPRLLETLHKQIYTDFEVIVVDSGSLDRTKEIASEGAEKLLCIRSEDFTFGYSLNVGVREAVGRYVALVSAHTIPASEEWLRELIGPLREEQTAMVYGRQLGGEKSKFSEIQDMRRTFGLSRMILGPPHFFANNANSALRRDLWEKHPFEEGLPGLEDIEWVKYWMERGFKVVYEPKAALYHIHEENWRQVRRRYYREAIAARRIRIKGRNHIFVEPVREMGRTILDIGLAVSGVVGEQGGVKKAWDRTLEVVQFRANKAISTVRGLLDGSMMENRIAKEDMFFDRRCQAVVIHGPGKASFEEVSIPEVKPGDALIRVAYEGFCTTDLEIFDGTLGYYKNGMAKYPIVPGHEFSGRVVLTGPNVNHLQVNDPVVVECIQSCGTCSECQRGNWIGCGGRTELGVFGRNGGYSQYVVVPGRFIHKLPAGVGLMDACLCEPLAVVLKGLKRLSRVWQNERIGLKCAVVGAGPMGNLCAQVLNLRGHRVTAFDRHSGRLACLSEIGIGVSDDLNRLREFDALVEVTGDPEALDVMLSKSSAGATFLLLGLPYAHKPFTFESIVAYDKTVVGSVGSSGQEFEEAIALLPRIDSRAFTEKVLSLSEFRRGWELGRHKKHLKILFQTN